MARVPFTLRIDTKERAALQHLSKVEGRPINQLLNEAIKVYLTRQGRKEHDLEANLASLRAYRKQDPGFRHAIAAFVEAETGHEDPVEGATIEGKFVEGKFVEGELQSPGPVQSKIRDILGA